MIAATVENWTCAAPCRQCPLAMNVMHRRYRSRWAVITCLHQANTSSAFSSLWPARQYCRAEQANRMEHVMKKISTFALAAALAVSLAAPVMAANLYGGAANAVMADHSMRSSKLIGAPVFNDEGQTIGSIVDILVKNQAAEPTAILSVGDFVGGGAKLVAVPLSHVKIDSGKASMAGVTRQMLASMPLYSFNELMGGGG